MAEILSGPSFMVSECPQTGFPEPYYKENAVRWFPLLLLFLLAYIEITLFIKVAAVVGVATTLLLVVFTSCVGVSLVKNQGMKTLCSYKKNWRWAKARRRKW